MDSFYKCLKEAKRLTENLGASKSNLGSVSMGSQSPGTTIHVSKRFGLVYQSSKINALQLKGEKA